MTTPTIPFSRSPGYVTIGEGLRLAARYWRSSIERWVLAVAAVALVNGLTAWLFADATLDQATMRRLLQMNAAGTPMDPAEAPRLLAGPLGVAAVSLVAGWFLAANAVAGLRGRDVTLGWVVAAGVRSLLANLLLISILLLGVLLSLTIGVLGLLVLLAAIPVGWYLLLRLQFWTLAIFDGSTVGEGLAVSWKLTRRSVLRVFGWSLALTGIGIVVAMFGLAVSLLVPVLPVAAAITAVADTTFSAFTIVALAILYESQRIRAAGPPPVIEPARSPFDPPAPPAPPSG